MQLFQSKKPFALESGAVLPEIELAYHTYGKLNTRKSNVVWIFHALTANSDAGDWWSGLVGEGRMFDPKQYYIVCANMLGSHYGSTAPTSKNPQTGKPYREAFPVITVRDVVKSHQLLAKQLGLKGAYLGIGGSMGGQQALEWAIEEPNFFDNVAVIACGAKQSPWGVALNEAQRMAIEADPTLHTDAPDAGAKGMSAARAMGMVSYRTYESFNLQQQDSDEKLTDFRAASYQQHQGLKLCKRFNAWSYLSLTKTMDSHNVGRGRGGAVTALNKIICNTLIVGIESDLLFPVSEQAYLAAHIVGAQFEMIPSRYGHDGFLIEYEKLTKLLRIFLKQPLPVRQTSVLC
jgi:homoserine O-acetyltransferase/O-succinyltransferase